MRKSLSCDGVFTPAKVGKHGVAPRFSALNHSKANAT